MAGLLADQHPDLAHMPLRAIEAGWDNAMFRLGDHLAVRLPRRAAAAALIDHEQTWLPRLAAQLLLQAPVPYRTGAASPRLSLALERVALAGGQRGRPERACRIAGPAICNLLARAACACACRRQ